MKYIYIIFGGDYVLFCPMLNSCPYDAQEWKHFDAQLNSDY